MSNNRVTVIGTVMGKFTYSHEYYNEKFYQFNLSVMRTSGVFDIIPILVSERLIDVTKDFTGCYASISGEYRSFNLRDEDKTKLILFVFPKEIKIVNELSYTNDILLQGTICKEPIYRETPQGRLITDVLLAVNRDSGKSDYLPCIAWGRNAFYLSTLHTGSVIRLVGRVQSREYNKNGAVRTAYEVSANMLEIVS